MTIAHDRRMNPIRLSVAAQEKLALYCEEHGTSASGVVEALLESLPRPDPAVLIELERAGRIERCGLDDRGNRVWRVRDTRSGVDAGSLEDPVLNAMRRLIGIIDRTGGYLRSEDQRTLHDARVLLPGKWEAKRWNPGTR